MIPDAEIARARAALPDILPMPLKRAGNLLVGLCPIHDEETPSFTVYPEDWHYFCFGCGAHGDAISYIRRTKGLAFADAVKQLIGVGPASWPQARYGRKHGAAPGGTEPPYFVSELWAGATRPSIAEWYLWSRGLAQKSLPDALRGHPAAWCSEMGERKGCMVAALSDPAGRVTAVQLTYVEPKLEYDGHTEFPKGARAAGLKVPKRTFGHMGAGAVKLAAAGEILGLAESVESALAAARLYRIPAWTVCGASRLGSIELPECVRHVVIFADGDEPGRAAAAKAESAYRRRGYGAQSEFPSKGKDFAEMIL